MVDMRGRKMSDTPCLLSIAGTDPCGGAGIQVDLQVFRDFGFHGLSVVTAVLSQNTRGVQRVDAMDAACVAQQLETLLEDIEPAGIKIGLLPSAEEVQAVSRVLQIFSPNPGCPVVFDPVLASSSRHPLVRPGCIAAMRTHLIPHIDLLTPNLAEAELLLDTRIQTRADFDAAAQDLLGLGCRAVLLKAGHPTPQEAARQAEDASATRRIRDVFADPHAMTTLRAMPAIAQDVRGTGCQLSSALLASMVARGLDACSGDRSARAGLIDAAEEARAYLNNLLHTRRRNIGAGRPVIVRERPAHP